MKRKESLILNNICKLILILFILILFFNLNVFAEAEYFTINVPKGYLVVKEEIDEIKLSVARADNKINFNIQITPTREYYEYTEESLRDLIKIASIDMTQYSVGEIDGKISKINKYPCYELIYEITGKSTNRKMSVRQIYLYEDTYSCIITIGGESRELITNDEIKESLDSFTLVKYERNNVKNLTDEEKKEINKQVTIEEGKFKGKILEFIDDFEDLDIKIQGLITVTAVLVLISIILIIKRLLSRNKVKKEKNKEEDKKEIA